MYKKIFFLFLVTTTCLSEAMIKTGRFTHKNKFKLLQQTIANSKKIFFSYKSCKDPDNRKISFEKNNFTRAERYEISNAVREKFKNLLKKFNPCNCSDTTPTETKKRLLYIQNSRNELGKVRNLVRKLKGYPSEPGILKHEYITKVVDVCFQMLLDDLYREHGQVVADNCECLASIKGLMVNKKTRFRSFKTSGLLKEFNKCKNCREKEIIAFKQKH